MKKKCHPGKRARRRLKGTIKRLKRNIDRLQLQIQSQEDLRRAELNCSQQRTEALPTPAAAMIYASELEAVRHHVLQYPNLETGGELFGWWSETGLPVIVLATGPGKKALHGATRFHSDEEYSFALGNAIAAHGLQHLASWHSHHRLGLSHPSGIDCRAMYDALHVPDSPIRRFLCGIATIEGNAVSLKTFFFSTATGQAYSPVPLVVKGGISLVRTGLGQLLATMEAKGA